MNMPIKGIQLALVACFFVRLFSEIVQIITFFTSVGFSSEPASLVNSSLAAYVERLTYPFDFLAYAAIIEVLRRILIARSSDDGQEVA